MNLKPRPLWLFWLGKGRWMTIAPNTYYPGGVDPSSFPAIIAHEQVHIAQQAGHEVLWLLKYLLCPSFRLSQEAEAIAMELTGYPQSQRDPVIAWYASALSSKPYLWAARSREAALAAITTAISKRGLCD